MKHLFLLLVILISAVSTAQAQEIDTSIPYRLTNTFLGTSRSLDTYGDGKNTPFMGKTGKYTGQQWTLTPLGGGYYRLTNTFLGSSRSLDTYSNGKNTPFMGVSGNSGGQYWKLTANRQGYRLTNKFLGTARSLDTYSNNKNDPFMCASGPQAGQVWTLVPYR